MPWHQAPIAASWHGNHRIAAAAADTAAITHNAVSHQPYNGISYGRLPNDYTPLLSLASAHRRHHLATGLLAVTGPQHRLRRLLWTGRRRDMGQSQCHGAGATRRGHCNLKQARARHPASFTASTAAATNYIPDAHRHKYHAASHTCNPVDDVSQWHIRTCPMLIPRLSSLPGTAPCRIGGTSWWRLLPHSDLRHCITSIPAPPIFVTRWPREHIYPEHQLSASERPQLLNDASRRCHKPLRAAACDNPSVISPQLPAATTATWIVHAQCAAHCRLPLLRPSPHKLCSPGQCTTVRLPAHTPATPK